MPQLLQRAIAFLVLVIAAPVLAGLALAIRLDTPGPILFGADRVGRNGAVFTCLKLRTMRPGAMSVGPRISTLRDPRVTRVGTLLRAHRLDELPQLWNVVRGQMLLVGPRPEDPRFVDLEDPLHRRVFLATPGITGITQLAYANEAALIDPADPEGQYRLEILPRKLELDARYLRARSSSLDAWVLLQTIRSVLGRSVPLADIETRLGHSGSR